MINNLTVVSSEAAGTLAGVARDRVGGETGAAVVTRPGLAGVLPLLTPLALVAGGTVAEEAVGGGDAGGAVEAGLGSAGTGDHSAGDCRGHGAV